MATPTSVKLYGRILFEMQIHAVTGLHIGGSAAALEIGGIDNPVIRDALTGAPYIPGSSLRGKMRSQFEKITGAVQNQSIGKDVRIHICKEQSEYETCPVCQVFGVPGESKATGPTRLVVRDAMLIPESLKGARTDFSYTEVKTEVAIDRVTSAATPRNLERVPAGAIFGPVEMVFSIYHEKDILRLQTLLQCLQLVEDDYLGGAGSRGSGKVAFEAIKIYARNHQSYAQRQDYPTEFGKLAKLEGDFENVLRWAKQTIFQGGQ